MNIVFVSTVAALAAAALAGALATGGAARSVTPAAEAPSDRLVDRHAGGFVPNHGQWPLQVRYAARFGAVAVRLEDRGFSFSVAAAANTAAAPRAAVVRASLVGAAAPALHGEQLLPGAQSHIVGRDATRWQTDLPRYARVRYQGLYPGVELVAYETDGGFEYDLTLAPGADLAAVEIQVSGATLRLDDQGDLLLDTPVGMVRQPRPYTYMLDDTGARVALPCRYELRGADRFGFVAPTWRGDQALVVDPGLVYSTFLGGSGDDEPYAVHLGADGVMTVAGRTQSLDFPVSAGAYDVTANGGYDLFVVRLDPRLRGNAQLLYATYLGGAGDERAWAVVADSSGLVTLAGETLSADFPTTSNAHARSLGGSVDAFVVQINPQGTVQLVYSSYLGGSSSDVAYGVAVDSAGRVFVVGNAFSIDFPTTANAHNSTRRGQSDVFVARFDLRSGGVLGYCTLLGGSSFEGVGSVALDGGGVVTVVGGTGSADFPTRAGFDTTLDGPMDAFVVRLDPSLPAAQQLLYGTLLGGSGNDSARRLHVDAVGVVTLVGPTDSADLPLSANAFDRTRSGSFDSLVARVDPRAVGALQLEYASYVGGSGVDDALYGVAADSAGVITLVGYTDSADFPTTPGAFDQVFGSHEGLVMRLDPNRPVAEQLLYSTFVGGGAIERIFAMALDPSGAVVVTGTTESRDFPTTVNAYAASHRGGQTDGFVVALDMLPAGVRRVGDSSAGCAGPLGISVTTMPRIGASSFAITGSGAPPSGAGQVFLASSVLASPLRVSGIDLHVDPATVFAAPTVTATLRGAVSLPLSIPALPALVGLRFYAQFMFAGPTSPPPCPPLGLSATSALEVVVQR